jgi:hypothetical protein
VDKALRCRRAKVWMNLQKRFDKIFGLSTHLFKNWSKHPTLQVTAFGMTIDSTTLASVPAFLTAISAKERRTASKQKIPEKHLSIFLGFNDIL